MMSYTYRAVHPTGRIHKGTMAAANENELAFFLRERNLELISAKTRRTGGPSHFTRKARIDAATRIAFCGQMADLLGAGLPFAQAFQGVIDVHSSGPLHDRLVMLANAIKAGETVSGAFQKHPDVLSPLHVSILKAGETSGDLASTFLRLTVQLQREQSLHDQLHRALRYPVFLLVVASGVTSFMMLVVIPQIIGFLSTIGQNLPFSTRLLIGCANVFAALWWTLPFVLIASFVGLRLAKGMSDEAAQIIDHFVLRLPAIGNVMHKLALARLTASLTLLLKSGHDVPHALAQATPTLANAHLEALAHHAHHQLMAGRSLSEACANLFSPPALQMLKIGEKSGTLPKALDDSARTYERESRDAIERFLGTLEPCLTLLVGALLAWVVLAVLGPVYGSLTPLSQGM